MTKAAEAAPTPPEPRDPSLNVHQRMLLVMERIGYIPKSGQAPPEMGGFMFVRDADVKDRVREECVRAGVLPSVSMYGRAFETIATKSGGQAILATVWGTMTFTNVDSPDQSVVIECHGQGLDRQDKALSKATTSAIKYGLISAFAIPTGQDPDGEHVEDIGPARQAPQRAQSRPTGPQQPRTGPGPAPGPDDGAPWPGGADAGPAGAASSRCPKHNTVWRRGQRGWYCPSKDPEGNERGYCVQTPSDAWVASQER